MVVVIGSPGRISSCFLFLGMSVNLGVTERSVLVVPRNEVGIYPTDRSVGSGDVASAAVDIDL